MSSQGHHPTTPIALRHCLAADLLPTRCLAYWACYSAGRAASSRARCACAINAVESCGWGISDQTYAGQMTLATLLGECWVLAWLVPSAWNAPLHALDT